MKKIIILIFISILIFSGNLLSNETKVLRTIPVSKIMAITGRINAIMTEIPATNNPSIGTPQAFIKVKVKDDKTGLEHSIQIAPGNFLKLNGIFLKKNDTIKVKIFQTQDSPEIKSLEINIKGKILKLRDTFGKGLWEKSQGVHKEKKSYKR